MKKLFFVLGILSFVISNHAFATGTLKTNFKVEEKNDNAVIYGSIVYLNSNTNLQYCELKEAYIPLTFSDSENTEEKIENIQWENEFNCDNMENITVKIGAIKFTKLNSIVIVVQIKNQSGNIFSDQKNYQLPNSTQVVDKTTSQK